MITGEDFCNEEDYGINPYESFMKRHLQHYGYYTGKNQSYKNQFQQYAEWEKNYAYNLGSSSSSDASLSDSDDEKHFDNKLQDDLLRTTQLIYSCGESGKMVPRLREPRSLYALNKELGPQQAARWPSDLQVLHERVVHIQTTPPEPEPFYKTTGYEKCPMVRGEANGGRIVFCYETNSSFFMKSRVGGSRSGCEPCAVKLESEDDTTLIFESRFESGNLGKAVQIGENEYELWLRYDLYTNKHTQWFYFRVSNTRADREYRFTVVNLMKPDSLYNNGMKPVMYSEKEAAINKVGWKRAGNNIKYYRNNVRYEQGRGDQYFYSVTWTVKMAHDDDTVYFSHCYPYTYTDLQDYLLEVTNDPIKSRICKQRVLCRTLAGNLVYVLTITSSSQNPEDMKHKKAVVVTARVHPGESNSSWMMKGFLDFVTGNSPDAKLLRDTFIFKVVPMLNPDGVVVGNYRCSLAGRDLNRNYKSSLKDAYPSIWHTKSLIRKLLMERNIIVYCDLHGHSRRQNVFIYGCEQHPTYGTSNYSGNNNNNNRKFHERVFPSMLSKNSPEKFCFKSCKFKVQKSKEGTGRVVVWNMGVQNSYTMEATFCGSSLGKKKGMHFNQHDFEMMGYHFCDTLLDYCDPDNTKYTKILVDLEDKHKMEVVTKIAQRGLQPDAVDAIDTMSTDTESSTGGSDSEISDGPPVHLQFAAARPTRRRPPRRPHIPVHSVRAPCHCFDEDWPKKKKLKSKRDRDKARKEEMKKIVTQQEEKRLRNNQVKPLKQDISKVQGQPIRYTSTSPKRPRSIDDRSNTGIPVFVQERFEEKQQKRNDYLEALTAAYISNNIPIVNDPDDVQRKTSTQAASTTKEPEKQNQAAEHYDDSVHPRSTSLQGIRPHTCSSRSRSAVLATADIWTPPQLSRSGTDVRGVVHFRYSGTNDRPSNQPTPVEGLCPHHEQALSNQLAAAQSNSAVTLIMRDGGLARDRVSRMFAPAAEEHTGLSSALRDLDLRRLTPKWLQEAAVKMYPLSHVRRGDAAFKISRLVARREDYARQAPTSMEDLVRHHLSQQPTSDRRPKPHLLEVSAAQQRQTDALLREKNGPAKTHPNPFDETFQKDERPKSHSSRPVSKQDSAKVSTPPVLQEEKVSPRKPGHKEREKNGRKSRKGMHGEGDEDTVGYQPRIQTAADDIFDGKGPTSHPPRVKSARTTPGMTTALSSIEEIQKSLQASGDVPSGNTHQQSDSNATGKYIQQLIKETSDEIEGLTNEIQEDIEKKQHYMKVKEEVTKNKKIASQKHWQQQQQERNQPKVNLDLNRFASAGKASLAIGTLGTFPEDVSKFGESNEKLGSRANRLTTEGGTLHSSSSSAKSNNTHIPYSGSSSADPPRLAVGPNLIVGGASNKRSQAQKQSEVSLEEEARRRNIKRQVANLYNANSAASQPTVLQQQLQQPCYSLSDLGEGPSSSGSGTIYTQLAPIEYTSLATPFRQLSSSQSAQQCAPTSSGMRLTKQNLVFKSDVQSASNLYPQPCTPRGAVEDLDFGESTTEQTRSRSARSGSRQVVETVPTKISLMICSQHQESPPTPQNNFLPLSRQGMRSSIYRNRKKEASIVGREELDSRQGRRK